MDAILSFDEHIVSATSARLSSLSQINRVKHLLDRNTLLNVISALVFSKLYYFSSVWSCVTKKNINRMSKTSPLRLLREIVFTRAAPAFHNLFMVMDVYLI